GPDRAAPGPTADGSAPIVAGAAERAGRGAAGACSRQPVPPATDDDRTAAGHRAQSCRRAVLPVAAAAPAAGALRMSGALLDAGAILVPGRLHGLSAHFEPG